MLADCDLIFSYSLFWQTRLKVFKPEPRKKLFFVILNTPVSPVGLLSNNSSELSASYVTVLFEINVFDTDILNVLVLPPVDPSNSKLAAYGNRPLCQDTGIVTVFIKQGMDLRWSSDKTIEEMVNQGVRNAYLDKGNPLRASIVKNPISERLNTKDNSPAVVHVSLVPGSDLDISIAAKGAGSENKAVLGMLNPSDNIVDFILGEIPKMGAGWCPPGVLGIGIGGTADKAMVMAKESLFETIDIQELIKNKYAPDKRVALFDIIFSYNNSIVILDGETNLKSAKQGFLNILDSLDIQYEDNIDLLPKKKRFGIINNSVGNLRGKPSHSSELVSQTLLGTKVDILKKQGEWYLIQTPDNYISWIDHGGIAIVSETEYSNYFEDNYIFNQTQGFAYESTQKNQIVSDLVVGSILKVIDKKNNSN